MLFAANTDLTRWWPRPGEGPVEYWTSLSPIAPFFGVPWRFAEIEEGRPAPRRAAKPKRTQIRKDVLDVDVQPAKAAPVKAAPAKAASPKPAAKPAPAKTAAPAKTVAPKAEPKPEAKAEVAPLASVKAAPVAEALKPAAAKPVAAEPVAAKPAAPEAADDLTLLKGVGPKMAANLKDQGVTSFADIATWDDAKIDRMDEALGGLPGRIRRDDWVGQAKALTKG